jgi:hypothetical protein
MFNFFNMTGALEINTGHMPGHHEMQVTWFPWPRAGSITQLPQHPYDIQNADAGEMRDITADG